MVRKVILVIAYTGYQPIEYGVTYEVLTSNNIEVATASDKPGTATASDGSTTPVNVTLDNIDQLKYDGIFLIGGPGTLEHLDTPRMHTLLQQFKALNKPYGAICIAPRILAKAQVLGNKKATGWDGDGKIKETFDRYGVTYSKSAVVTDGIAITANGPQAAEDFGQAIVQAFTKAEVGITQK